MVNNGFVFSGECTVIDWIPKFFIQNIFLENIANHKNNKFTVNLSEPHVDWGTIINWPFFLKISFYFESRTDKSDLALLEKKNLENRFCDMQSQTWFIPSILSWNEIRTNWSLCPITSLAVRSPICVMQFYLFNSQVAIWNFQCKFSNRN